MFESPIALLLALLVPSITFLLALKVYMTGGNNTAKVPEVEPEFVAINAGDWFVLKFSTERDGVYALRHSTSSMQWQFKENLNYEKDLVYNIFDYPNIYAFSSIEEAVARLEEVCGEEVRRVSKSEKFLSEFGKHIYFQRESSPEPKIEGQIHDLDAFMEAQFGDEDLSDIKLGAEGSFNEKKV